MPPAPLPSVLKHLRRNPTDTSAQRRIGLAGWLMRHREMISIYHLEIVDKSLAKLCMFSVYLQDRRLEIWLVNIGLETSM